MGCGIRILKRIRPFVRLEHFINVYRSIVEPYFTYRPFPHSSQARARKHESEALVDKHQTWRTTPSLLRAVPVANTVVSLVAKVLFTTISGKKLIFHFFSFPLEAKSRNRWLLAIKRQENRDGFVVTESVSVKRRLRTADCGSGVKCRESVKCRLQTESKTQAGCKMKNEYCTPSSSNS